MSIRSQSEPLIEDRETEIFLCRESDQMVGSDDIDE